MVDIEEFGLDKHFKKGLDLLHRMNETEATAKFLKSLKKNPKHLATYKNLGYIYIRSNNNAQLLKIMEQGLKYHKEDSWLWYFKGHAQKQLNRFKDAIESLEMSLKYNPDDCDTWTLKGNSHRELKDYESAFQCWDNSIKINPFYELAWQNKINLLNSLEKKEELVKTLSNRSKFYYDKGLEQREKRKLLSAAVYFGGSLKYLKEFPLGNEKLNETLEKIYDAPEIFSEYGFKLSKLDNSPRKGLIFYDMGMKNPNLTETAETIKELSKKYEIPNGLVKMFPYYEKTIIGIEYLPPIFEKFIKELKIPYFELDPANKLVMIAPEKADLGMMLQELGIVPVRLTNFSDKDLSFFNIGKLEGESMGDTTKKVLVLSEYLGLEIQRLKMFILKGMMIVAVEHVSGAYKKFQDATNIEPIEFSFK